MPGAGDKEGRPGREQKVCRAVKLLCMTPEWWVHITTRVFRPIKRTALRVSLHVNCGLRVRVDSPVVTSTARDVNIGTLCIGVRGG